MTQYGSGSGVPLTGFTYDLASDDSIITTRSEVRLQIGDSVQGAGPRPDFSNYSDVEVDYFLAQEAGHLQRAAALALETLSSEWAKEASKQQLGPASSEANQARAFAERAAALRKAYGYTDASFQPGAGPTTGGYISWKQFYADGGL
jgi:hypothetical protein